VQNAVRAKNVSLLVSPQAVLFMQPTADITSAVTAELDKLVPTVSITPPANWQPDQQTIQLLQDVQQVRLAAAQAMAQQQQQRTEEVQALREVGLFDETLGVFALHRSTAGRFRVRLAVSYTAACGEVAERPSLYDLAQVDFTPDNPR